MYRQLTGALGSIVFLVIPKFLATFAGLGLIAFALLTGPNWAFVGWGAVALVLGWILHAVDGALLDRKLIALAKRAVQGTGPVPPRDVRRALARQAAGFGGGDFESAFAHGCVEWSVGTARAGRPVL